MFRFTTRELLILTVTAGLAVGWWLDRRQVIPLQKRCDRLEKLAHGSVAVFRNLGIDANFTGDNIEAGASYWPPERAPWNQEDQCPTTIAASAR
jgi:hypothetical protein